VLWKAPWGLCEPGTGFAPAPTSEVARLEHFAGGWQELFPNGDACAYNEVERPFHGDASTQPWIATVRADTPCEARVRLAGRLFRSPFRIEPTMVARGGASALTLNERVTTRDPSPWPRCGATIPARAPRS